MGHKKENKGIKIRDEGEAEKRSYKRQEIGNEVGEKEGKRESI